MEFEVVHCIFTLGAIGIRAYKVFFQNLALIILDHPQLFVFKRVHTHGLLYFL